MVALQNNTGFDLAKENLFDLQINHLLVCLERTMVWLLHAVLIVISLKMAPPPLCPCLTSVGPPVKGGATNLKVGGQCIGRWGVNTLKTLKFEKDRGCMTPPQLQWWCRPCLLWLLSPCIKKIVTKNVFTFKVMRVLFNKQVYGRQRFFKGGETP